MGFFQGVFGFLLSFRFFGFQVFFRFRVHPRVKNETRTQTRFYAGRVRVTGAKMHLNPHPSGAKPTGYTKPELPFLSNNDDCPCVFIHKPSIVFCIISVYVDDLNIIGTELDINETQDHLKMEFKMKDLGKTKFWLGLQLEHLPTGIN
jgi:hypothetical protein